MGLSTLKVMSTVAGLALLPVVCLAQPAEFVDLGRFDDVALRSLVQTPIITDAAHPVRWFALTLPRITDPHRFLDIWTLNQLSFDTEIALYAPDGTLIATDDDDGADNHSALSFGIINTSAPMRLHPTAFAGQAAGVPNDGRDGALSGPYPAGLGATAATYYIAVTAYNAIFANGFSVTHVNTPVGIVTSLAVRMNTPGGEVPPTVGGSASEQRVGDSSLYVQAIASANTIAVHVDASTVNGPNNHPIGYNGLQEIWEGFVPLNSPLSQPGTYPLVFRASNTMGDVAISNLTLIVRPANSTCEDGFRQPLSSTPGTNIYTYDTRNAGIDGPWPQSACSSFTPTGNDVWFRFVPSVNGLLTLSTCKADTGATGPQPDTLLGIRENCSGVFEACGDDVGGCGVGTRLPNIPVSAGHEYNIAVRAYEGDIVGGLLAATFVAAVLCDSIDFNNDTSFFDPQDIEAFLSVYSEGPCIPPAATCNDIDFNNDTSLFDPCDINSFLVVYSEGPCTPCGV